MLLYLHGFNSAPESHKATQLRKWCQQYHPELHVEVPYLKPYPQEAIQQLQTLIESALAQGEDVGLMGSSLGGYYATFLAERYDLPAVLINPAVRSFETLQEYLGEIKNYYNDDICTFEQRHIDEIEALYCQKLTQPERYLLFVQTGDETLDFKEATKRYFASENVIEYGGNHSFEGFERWFTYSLRFLHCVKS